MLIADGNYRWKISDRLAVIENSNLPEAWKAFYCEAVEFKHAPHRELKPDMKSFWHGVRDFFQAAVARCAGEKTDLRKGFLTCCSQGGELSFKHYIKYCIKSRSLPIAAWKYYTMPTVAVLAGNVCSALDRMPEKIDEQLYRHWLIFN